MKNAIAMSALALGLAFGTAQASFAQGAGGAGGAGGQVDGGATMKSGEPTSAQQGAGTAMGQSKTGTTGSGMSRDHMKTKDHMKKGDMK